MSEKRSRVATTALQIATFGLVSTLGGILGVQVGLLAPMTAFTLFGLGTLICGTAALVIGAIGFVRARSGGTGADRQRAGIAAGIGVALLAVVIIAGSMGDDVPPINDITTNLADPPAFAPADSVPAYADRDMGYPPAFADQVRAAYPDLQPLASDLGTQDAYALALDSARELGWEITYQDPAAGRFDASETTRLFRFVDDVTVRVRPSGAGSTIAVRSKSRDGRSDLGANAARIRRFAAVVESPDVATR